MHNSCSLFYSLLYRYREESDDEDDLLSEEYKESTHLLPQDTAVSTDAFLGQIFNLQQLPRSTYVTSYVVSFMTSLFGEILFSNKFRGELELRYNLILGISSEKLHFSF